MFGACYTTERFPLDLKVWAKPTYVVMFSPNISIGMVFNFWNLIEEEEEAEKQRKEEEKRMIRDVTPQNQGNLGWELNTTS